MMYCEKLNHQVKNHGGKNVTTLGVVMYDDIKIILPWLLIPAGVLLYEYPTDIKLIDLLPMVSYISIGFEQKEF